jgi:hypothetical protein
MKKTVTFLMIFLFCRNYSHANALFDFNTDYPTQQDFNLTFYFVQPAQFSVGWNYGDGTSRIVFITESDTGTAFPIDGTTYSADSEYGKGSDINGWYDCPFSD